MNSDFGWTNYAKCLALLATLALVGALWAEEKANPNPASKPSTATASGPASRPAFRLTNEQKARIMAAKADIASIGTALKMFEIDNGRYPTTAEGLASLITRPGNLPGWKGPYVEKGSFQKDPWGNAYVYRCPAKADPDDYELTTCGPDGREGTEDDIGR